jgi:hypothetical protein
MIWIWPSMDKILNIATVKTMNLLCIVFLEQMILIWVITKSVTNSKLSMSE